MEHSDTEKIVWPEKLDASFTKNVIDAFPFDIHSLYSLIGIFDMAYNEKVPTAAMRLVGLPRVLVNKEWVMKWVLTWSDMAAVVYHEITHRMLKHLAEGEIWGSRGFSHDQVNFLLDVRVQGLAYQVMDHPVYQNIWKRYYANSPYPLTLLSSSSTFDRYTVRKLHEEIYSPFGVSLEKVAAFVFGDDDDAFKSMHNGEEGGEADSGTNNQQNSDGGKPEPEKDDSDAPDEPFVGSHGDDSDDVMLPAVDMLDHIKEIEGMIKEKVSDEAAKSEKADAVRELVNTGKMEQPIGHEKEWAFSNSQFLMDLKEVGDIYNADNRMKERMMHIAVETEELKAKKAIRAMFPDVPDIGTRPNFRDKRAMVLYSMGHWPVLFENMTEDPRGLCHIYIDDSGSQFHVIAFVIKLFAGLRDYLFPEIHFFSTKIWSTHRSNLKSDMKIQTTGGTDMNVVVTHALKNRISKCLVITDGYGPLSEQNAELAHRAGQKYLIGFTESAHGNGFDSVAWKEFDIPKKEG